MFLQSIGHLIEVGLHHFVDCQYLRLALGDAPHVALVVLVRQTLPALGFMCSLAPLHLETQRHEHLHVDRKVCAVHHEPIVPLAFGSLVAPPPIVPRK